ncbi:hypothetical protein P8625_01650 [Tenacibaculum tangerinum]|uniref:Pesticidal crystal protein N-terminal domain-containing protein n=1 Tax=Tenacibaculum tangerinum TaxID=3038772 RepID=A0ABY8L3E6_9FLAO|nr:hypothetical protein [Tenacibaculum tangerinum]WGH75895.1 hypothetical protein P8625_01650 [Tenacibaculum tangerinum]
MIQLTPKKLSTINPDILLVYGNLQPETPKEYYTVKVNTLVQKRLPGAPSISIDIGNLMTEIKVAKPEDVPSIPKELEPNMNCLKRGITDEYPLLPNEVILRNRMTFLSETFQDFPIRTLVFELTTNKAILYFLIKNIGLNNEYVPILQESEFTQPQKLYPSLDSLSLKLNVTSTAVSIGKDIASGMLSAIGGAIANAILDEVFPAKIPNYFDEVYAKITKIVKQEIQQSKIDSISGAITNLVQKIKNEYVPALEQSNTKDKEDRQALFKLLQKYDQTFLSGAEGMLGTLQQKEYAKAGFTVFMLGASLQLSLYQEMANVDPMNKNAKGEWMPANKSSYGKPKTGTLAKTANDFIEHAKKTYNEIMTDSNNAVKAQKFKKERSYVIGQTLVTNTYYYGRIVDNGVATNILREIGPDAKNGSNPKFEAFTKSEIPKYKKTKRENLYKEMNSPLEVIESWKELVKTPIKIA